MNREGHSVAQICEAFLLAGSDAYKKQGGKFLKRALGSSPSLPLIDLHWTLSLVRMKSSPPWVRAAWVRYIDLDGDLTVETRITCAIHFSHPTCSEWGLNFIWA